MKGMKALVAVFLMVFSLTGLVQTSGAVATSPNDYYVSPTGGGTDCTQASPCAFQTALDKAGSDGTDSTVHVMSGTYDSTNGLSSTLTYSTADGDGALTIEAVDPTDPPVLDGGYSMQIMNIDNDSDNDNTGDQGADITIRNLIFQGGSGGLHVYAGEANITIEDNSFIDNSAEDGAGAYVYTYSGSATVRRNIFDGNNAGFGAGARVGTDSGSLAITNNTFTGNSAYDGGGVYVRTNSGTASLTNNTFSGNSAADYGGGAYVWTYSGTATLTNNTFSGNSADFDGIGGGAYVWIYSGTATLTNNTFSGNSAANFGGGAYLETSSDSATANIYNNIIYSNAANAGGNDGDDLYVDSDGNHNNTGSIINLNNNNLGPNSDFTTGQSEDLRITVTGSNYSQGGNITDDPLLNGDFHLQSGSPCIDAGDNNAYGIPSTDFEGDDRTIDGNGDGASTVDMGADEYQPYRPVPTLNTYGIIFLVLLSGLSGLVALRKKGRERQV